MVRDTVAIFEWWANSMSCELNLTIIISKVFRFLEITEVSYFLLIGGVVHG